jgi:hypothetical protein
MVGHEAFVEHMARLGLHPRVEAGLVIYDLEPVDGARAGTVLDTAVGVDVLAVLPGGGAPDPVVCREGRVLACAFHPELTAARRLGAAGGYR